MTFKEWQDKHGPNGGEYDIEMQRAGWDGAMTHSQCKEQQETIDKLVEALKNIREESGDAIGRNGNYISDIAAAALKEMKVRSDGKYC